ncbi:MAG: CBS domain-containing protein [Chloroflexi bacterium]|nr:CBS domain-containing protein [Chloroflexota bacterium]
MQAKDVMTPGFVAVNQRAKLREVIARMVTERLSGLLVADNYDRLVGVITELEVIQGLLDGLDPEQASAQDVMSRRIPAVAADASIHDVLRALTTDRVNRVSVVQNGALVGLISRGDVLKASLPQRAA